ncbi:hypothetical protein RZQ20_22435, partial [Raoultella ornithinolytica]|uniref:hypothetical protein n=1 Tax=Raoultella ornithinolytica TaxID=54291 RepID=UPI00292BA1EE
RTLGEGADCRIIRIAQKLDTHAFALPVYVCIDLLTDHSRIKENEPRQHLYVLLHACRHWHDLLYFRLTGVR